MSGPVQNFTDELLARLPSRLGRKPDFVIGAVADPYLLSWWVIPRNRFFNIYLHQILKDDDDRALHDHPWWNISFVLKGRLREVMPNDKARRLKRFWPYLRRAKALHRLEVIEGPWELVSYKKGHAKIAFPKHPVWTLFITGPRVRDWGFQCPKDSPAGGWRHWKDFTAKNPGEVGRGCGELD